MRHTLQLSVLLFGLLLLTTAAYADFPREQLQQMVEQLQKSPNDSALREKIIKLAQEIKPAPAVPDTAVEFEGRAQFAFKNAKSNDDFLAAAREYEKALTGAPWVSGYYSDLCTIYEKAGKFDDAKRNCEFSLIGLADSSQITDIKRRIAGLKYGIEQNSPSAVAERKKNQGEDFLRKLDGARFVHRIHQTFENNRGETSWADSMRIYEIRGNKIAEGYIITAQDKPSKYNPTGVMQWVGEYFIDGREFTIPKNDQHCQGIQNRCFDEIQTISEDGNKIVERRTSGGKLEEKIFLREK